VSLFCAADVIIHEPSRTFISIRTMMNSRRYWISFGAGLVVILALTDYLSMGPLATRPARPALPAVGRTFLAEYNASDAIADREIFRHGLFGLGPELRDRDLFLLGSSRVEFGLSAASLSALLSKDGRSVRAFNLGLGCGEAVRFDLDILADAAAFGRSAIADATTLNRPVSWCGERSAGHDIFAAYAQVFRVWTKFLYDWSLDPLLPRLEITTAGPLFRRFLFGLAVERDWQTGDVVRAWHPVTGLFYPRPPQPGADVAEAARALGTGWQTDGIAIEVDAPVRAGAADLGLALAVTRIPFAFKRPDYASSFAAVSAGIRSAASDETRCFAPIAAEGLLSWDGGNHLTGDSREDATGRLATALGTHFCLDALHLDAR
jgi:hypothetical protein